ncbi:MAG: hypothetical protein WAM91_02565 [Candidatus Acidiferrales bacterium]
MYTSVMRTWSFTLCVVIASALCALVAGAARAQLQPELSLNAKRRLFPIVGAGVRAIKSGPDGRYYLLTLHAVLVFNTTGTQIGEIPPPPVNGKKNPDALNYAEAFDVGADGRIYVADRGANALRVFTAAGARVLSVSFPSPMGIVALSGGEFAGATSTAKHLISVFDMSGTEVRTFGDPVDLAETPESNQYLSIARLATDTASNIYLAFTNFPEPTVRKYDRFGYAALETVLDTPDFAPAAQAIRREVKRVDAKGGPLHLKQRISAVGVDPEGQTVWLAIGDELLRFDRDGKFVMRYTLYMADGSHFEPNSILIERDRILLSTNLQGIYEFSRPDKDPALAPPAEKHF